MLLSELLCGTDVVLGEGLSSVCVKGISYDTRRIETGDVFIALKGAHSDGCEYAFDAEKKGAVAYIGEKSVSGLKIPQLLTSNARRTLSFACSNFYGNPERKLRIIGITGTNGKTSTAFMLKRILSHGGYKTALIGTVKCMIGEEDYVPDLCDAVKKNLSTMTTPDPDVLYYMMRDMVDHGVEILVMEVSSHALALEKLAPIHFSIGIFTNLSAEHLDFHLSMEEYLKAKSKLFSQSELAVINADDSYSEMLEGLVKCKKVFFGIRDRKEYYADKIKVNGDAGSEYVLHSPSSCFKIKTVIPGKFTIYNTMAAAVAAREIGVNLVSVQNAIYSMNGVCGRLERVKLGFNDKKLSVFIDYAHTPYAMENLLNCVNAFRKEGQRIVTVFGCGGERDKEKRSIMGKIATQMSDFTIITGDNPRNEDPDAIIEDILSGVETVGNFEIIKNRKEAIEFAINTSVCGDIILLVGKGHEQYEIDRGGIHPFSETEIVQNAVRDRKR